LRRKSNREIKEVENPKRPPSIYIKALAKEMYKEA